MSRVRLGCALAFCGILITTGGCGSSATAPEAASYEFGANRFTNPTDRDGVAPAEPTTTPAPDGDEVYTTSSGFITGGGRADN
ncbi:MAG TPA: hypothetical protein VHG93_20105 [Longimicrobium sp.]|nr:hypothetical protein [Longimicrobium sp.]